MIQDLDLTLKTLVQSVAGTSTTTFTLLRAAEVSFLTPDSDYSKSVGQNTVDFFLYDVKENRDLRVNTPTLIKTGTTFTRVLPPLRLDCSYIVTAWSSSQGDVQVAQEHQLLAEALQWLKGFPLIPSSAWQGELVNSIYPPPLWTALVDPNKNAGEFWLALGISPRAAFFVTVTLALPIGTSVTAPAVATVATSVQPADAQLQADGMLQVGGQVQTATGTAVAAATVALLNAAGNVVAQATTDARGNYAFARVVEGNYVLQAAAVGFQVATKSVGIPGTAASYNVVLQPLP